MKKMKKLLLSISFLISVFCLNAQDSILKINGEKIIAKVLEIGTSNVKYKKFSNLDGPTYTINKKEIKLIVFENGETESFSQLEVNTNDNSNNNDTTKITLEKAQVYFIRFTGFKGSTGAFKAFIDKELVCKLNNKRYSIHDVNPGEHIFTAQFGGKKAKKRAEPISINIEAGKTYYIQMVFQTGAFKNNLYCQEVTENSAKTVLVDCKQDTKCF